MIKKLSNEEIKQQVRSLDKIATDLSMDGDIPYGVAIQLMEVAAIHEQTLAIERLQMTIVEINPE